jgi:hypothetical protein
MSIWEGICVEEFRANVARIYQIAKATNLSTPGPQTNESFANYDTIDWFPFATERTLAEDFAFLVSYQDTPSCVAAATISPTRSSHVATLTIAANHGVGTAVVNTFEKLKAVLTACAQRSKYMKLTCSPAVNHSS